MSPIDWQWGGENLRFPFLHVNILILIYGKMSSAEQVHWLYKQWVLMDFWVGQRLNISHSEGNHMRGNGEGWGKNKEPSELDEKQLQCPCYTFIDEDESLEF